MLSPLDSYFAGQPEPLKSCLAFLRGHILRHSADITEGWSYGMPFYYVKGKRFCYLWVSKKEKKPYIGFVDGYKMQHPELLQEKRSRMKIWFVDTLGDIPVAVLDELLREALRNS